MMALLMLEMSTPGKSFKARTSVSGISYPSLVFEQPTGPTTWVPDSPRASSETDAIPVEQYPRTPVRISPLLMRFLSELSPNHPAKGASGSYKGLLLSQGSLLDVDVDLEQVDLLDDRDGKGH